MKYNIITVSNESYKEFLFVFLKSLFDNADSDNLNSVFVFDTGLKEETKREFQSISKKIQFEKTNINSQSGKIHDEGWRASTYAKTSFLYSVIYSTEEPCFLIDVDSVFNRNFESEIDWDADFTACYRGPNHPICNFLGSFFGGINPARSLIFIKHWIVTLQWFNCMNSHEETLVRFGENINRSFAFNHFESPSLSEAWRSFSPHFSAKEIDESKISCIGNNPEAYIYHLKSDSYALTIEQRLKLPYASKIVKKYV
tara:strand:+ start:447 stop:1214 length:768 start_codon:yes stop_codon:yes gene_type:complete